MHAPTAGCTLRAKIEANNRNMTSKQQRTAAIIFFHRHLFASLFALFASLRHLFPALGGVHTRSEIAKRSEQSTNEPVTFRIGNSEIANSSQEKLLVVQIDNKLSFDNHVSKLCQKASNKLYALAHISPYMDQNKLRTLVRALITSQFQYCPLIWMFHSRQLNKKINKIQKRALRITYKDAESTCSELLRPVSIEANPSKNQRPANSEHAH